MKYAEELQRNFSKTKNITLIK